MTAFASLLGVVLPTVVGAYVAIVGQAPMWIRILATIYVTIMLLALAVNSSSGAAK